MSFCCSGASGVLACLTLGLAFVAVLYAGNQQKKPNRDNPEVIKLRFRRVALLCAIAPLALLYSAQALARADKSKCATTLQHSMLRWLGLGLRHQQNPLLAIFSPIALTVCLFTGPLLHAHLDHGALVMRRIKLSKFQPGLLFMRNFIIGPATEEWIFRSCMCPLVFSAGFSDLENIIITAVIFATAHLHHWVDANSSLLVLCVQFTYTGLFGAYASYLFLRTGLFYGPFLAHAFCNIMGLPNFWAISSHRNARLLVFVYTFGVVIFCVITYLDAIYRPPLFNSIFWSESI